MSGLIRLIYPKKKYLGEMHWVKHKKRPKRRPVKDEKFCSECGVKLSSYNLSDFCFAHRPHNYLVGQYVKAGKKRGKKT